MRLYNIVKPHLRDAVAPPAHRDASFFSSRPDPTPYPSARRLGAAVPAGRAPNLTDNGSLPKSGWKTADPVLKSRACAAKTGQGFLLSRSSSRSVRTRSSSPATSVIHAAARLRPSGVTVRPRSARGPDRGRTVRLHLVECFGPLVGAGVRTVGVQAPFELVDRAHLASLPRRRRMTPGSTMW